MSYGLRVLYKLLLREQYKNASGRTRAHIPETQDVVIRAGRPEDARLLHDLASVDSASDLAAPTLLALVDGEAWAAISLVDHRVVADPFRPSAGAAQLLRIRAFQLTLDQPARSVRMRQGSAVRARP